MNKNVEESRLFESKTGLINYLSDFFLNNLSDRKDDNKNIMYISSVKNQYYTSILVPNKVHKNFNLKNHLTAILDFEEGSRHKEKFLRMDSSITKQQMLNFIKQNLITFFHIKDNFKVSCYRMDKIFTISQENNKIILNTNCNNKELKLTFIMGY